ncbi:hypothetical protein PG996_004704 [Apiospora saccharicola]|uniref:Uncharacterized protein n=1 Tax=Apiospora saccharicola TaxID=335842 RepID=A0ABR1W4Y3_9PEZI
MSSRLAEGVSDMSIDENSNTTTKQEVSDRKIDQDHSEGNDSGSNIDEDEDEDKDDHGPYLNSRLSDDGKSWISVGGRAPRAPSHDPTPHNWDLVITDTMNWAREKKGIVEIPPNETARVMEGGKLIGIFHVQSFAPAQNFIVYDGQDVLARVQDLDKKHAIHTLAYLHIGRHLGWHRPHDHDLAFTIIEMKGQGQLAGGYAVKISPLPEGPLRKKKRSHVTMEMISA